jgi:hypothetical protein
MELLLLLHLYFKFFKVGVCQKLIFHLNNKMTEEGGDLIVV